MDDAFDERCGDDDGGAMCPICRGDVSSEFVSIIKAAAQLEGAMTADEFTAWLDSV